MVTCSTPVNSDQLEGRTCSKLTDRPLCRVYKELVKFCGVQYMSVFGTASVQFVSWAHDDGLLSDTVSICQYLPLTLKWASCCRGAEEEHVTLGRYLTGTAHYVFLFTRHEGKLGEWRCDSYNSQAQH